ncbi:MAG: hypothetical protein WCR45_06035 [Bacteroidaceae bacterium]
MNYENNKTNKSRFSFPLLKHKIALLSLIIMSLLPGQLISAQALKPIKSYSFSERIYSIQSDTTQHYLLVNTRSLTKSGKYLKNKGLMILFDLTTEKELWRKPFNYAIQTAFIYPDGVLVKNDFKSTTLYQFADGKKLWNIDGTFTIYDNKTDKLFWYKYSAYKANDKHLNYRDFKTGKILWTTTLPHKYGWKDLYIVNDSIRLIVSDGLHLINIHNGSGYHYTAETGEIRHSDRITNFFVTALSVGFLGIYAQPKVSYVKNTYSNIIYQDAHYYMADSKNLFCLNDTLGEVWKQTLPKKLISSSHILSDSTHIYMTNYGRENTNDKEIGIPFIACYNRKDGHLIYLNQIKDKKAQIHNSFHKGNKEYILFDKEIVCRTLSTDSSEVKVMPWDAKKYGNLNSIVFNDVYFANADSTIFRKMSSDYYRILLLTDTNTICEVNEEMQVVVAHPFSECFYPAAQSKNEILLEGYGTLFLTNSLGMLQRKIKDVIYPLNTSGNHVYVISKEKDKVLDITLR